MLDSAGCARGERARHPAPCGGHRIERDPPAVVSPTPAQTIDGFGASGAWWPHDLAEFDPGVQREVADLLFGERGIALSAYRYNIGGGGTGGVNAAHAPENFLVRPGQYDWSRDASGRRFLEMAAERSVPVLVGFANSAPPAWTTNGQCRGGALSAGAEAAYSAYLADVAGHFAQAGMPFAYISPMNEPDSTFAGSDQEGMAVPIHQRATLVRALASELRSRGLSTLVAADESSRLRDQFMRELPQWLDMGTTREAVGVLCHHIYDFPNAATLREARQLAEHYGKVLWMTEICCFESATGKWGQQCDPTMASAMVLANLIGDCLVEASHAGFHWWLACSPALGVEPAADPEGARQPTAAGWNDALLYYDRRFRSNGNQRIYVTKRFHVFGNFSRHVRPGARRHEVTAAPAGTRILAFSDASGWTIVVINNRAAAADFVLRLPSRVTGITNAVETSATRSLEPVPVPRLEGSAAVVAALPAQSVTTLTLT